MSCAYWRSSLTKEDGTDWNFKLSGDREDFLKAVDAIDTQVSPEQRAECKSCMGNSKNNDTQSVYNRLKKCVDATAPDALQITRFILSLLFVVLWMIAFFLMIFSRSMMIVGILLLVGFISALVAVVISTFGVSEKEEKMLKTFFPW